MCTLQLVISCWINEHSLLWTSVDLLWAFLGGNDFLVLVRGILGHRDTRPTPAILYQWQWGDCHQFPVRTLQRRKRQTNYINNTACHLYSYPNVLTFSSYSSRKIWELCIFFVSKTLGRTLKYIANKRSFQFEHSKLNILKLHEVVIELWRTEEWIL